ncbi:MAG TPA: hypothetical protein VD905_01025 [Flavobacteriales bacterium]|nr:hypothetical protein [Flavobacteriales bacterium]
MGLLDEPQKQKDLVITGNNRLTRGSIFAVITLVWFIFLFSFIDMNWQNFTPTAPFVGITDKHKYIFYFICFSFFISSLVFSFVFFKNNMQPADLLMRFACIIIFFVLVYLFYLLIRYGLQTQRELFGGGLAFIRTPGIAIKILNTGITFLLFYLLFYPFILFFGKVFYNGNFGISGFILCFFITAIFHISLYLLMDLAPKLEKTSLPVSDWIVTLFFTLSAFGMGVISGNEKKPVKKSRRVSSIENLHRY